MCLARSWNHYCATRRPSSHPLAHTQHTLSWVIADSAQLTKPTTMHERERERRAARETRTLEKGILPRIRQGKSAVHVASSLQSPRHVSRPIPVIPNRFFSGRVTRVGELGYWVKTVPGNSSCGNGTSSSQTATITDTSGVAFRVKSSASSVVDSIYKQRYTSAFDPPLYFVFTS